MEMCKREFGMWQHLRFCVIFIFAQAFDNDLYQLLNNNNNNNNGESLVDAVAALRDSKVQQLAHRTEHRLVSQEYKEWYTYNKVTLYPKRNFIRRLSTIINDEHHILMCTLPKIGSSSWRKFMLYLQFPDLTGIDGLKKYEAKYGVPKPNQHNMTKNGLKLIATQTPEDAQNYYNNPEYLKLFHTRNPITRLLSAWLSKNSKSSDPMEFAKKHLTFEAFVQDLFTNKVNLTSADEHIRYQKVFCDIDRGAHYDIFLKFEARKYWGPLLLGHIRQHQHLGQSLSSTKTDSDSKSSIINMAALEALVLRSQINQYNADSILTILTHYSLPVFDMACEMYRDDIAVFGYESEVMFLRDMVEMKSVILA